MFAAMQSASSQTISQALNKRFDSFKKQSSQERVFVITDRDIYGPGEKIWITAIVFDIHSPSIAAVGDDVVVGLYNYSDEEIFTVKLPREKGIAMGGLQLPIAIAEDVYYLQAGTSKSGESPNYFKKIIIKPKPIPQFIVEATIPDKMFKPGEEIPMQLSVRDFYSEPINNVDFVVELFDGTKKLTGLSGKIKKEVNASLKIEVPMKLNSGLMHYRITAETKGKNAILTGAIRTVPNKVNIALYPENGRFINNIPTTVRYHIFDDVGRPVEAEGAMMARNERLIPVKSNARGMGFFTFTPTVDAIYSLQFDLPDTEGASISFPVVSSKGMALSVTKISDNTVNVKINSAYTGIAPAILIGESNGKIFHISEHKIDKEEQVSIDITNTRDAMIQFVLANASAEIESTQNLYSGSFPETVAMDPVEENLTSRGKMLFEADYSAGTIIMSAVNQPWIHDNLSNQKPWILSLPYDLSSQPVFQSEGFLRGASDPELMQQFTSYYVADEFGWDKILNSKAPFTVSKTPRQVMENRKLLDKILLNGNEILRDGQIVHSNLNASAYFSTANPHYIQSLYSEKAEVVPGYKKMLMSGVAVPEVIQNIRAYKMDGGNIVFVGITNSISYQGGALIVIDGVNRGTDASILSQISPYTVDRIFVSTNPVDIHKYTALNSMGLIEIWLKKPDVGFTSKQAGPPEETDFRSIDHSKATEGPDNDYRSTLHWNTSAVVEGNNWSQKYYNSDLLSAVKVIVYVIPNTGRPIEYRADYRIGQK